MSTLDDHLLTGVIELDLQHGHLLALLNALIDNPDATPGSESFSDILSRLGHELFAHFHYEEDLMHRTGINEHHTQRHRDAHNNIINQYTEMHFSMMDGTMPERAKALEQVRGWVIEHLLEFDLPMSRSLRPSGAKSAT